MSKTYKIDKIVYKDTKSIGVEGFENLITTLTNDVSVVLLDIQGERSLDCSKQISSNGILSSLEYPEKRRQINFKRLKRPSNATTKEVLVIQVGISGLEATYKWMPRVQGPTITVEAMIIQIFKFTKTCLEEKNVEGIGLKAKESSEES